MGLVRKAAAPRRWSDTAQRGQWEVCYTVAVVAGDIESAETFTGRQGRADLCRAALQRRQIDLGQEGEFAICDESHIPAGVDRGAKGLVHSRKRSGVGLVWNKRCFNASGPVSCVIGVVGRLISPTSGAKSEETKT
jgi:hypothetical protein